MSRMKVDKVDLQVVGGLHWEYVSAQITVLCPLASVGGCKGKIKFPEIIMGRRWESGGEYEPFKNPLEERENLQHPLEESCPECGVKVAVTAAVVRKIIPKANAYARKHLVRRREERL